MARALLLPTLYMLVVSGKGSWVRFQFGLLGSMQNIGKVLGPLMIGLMASSSVLLSLGQDVLWIGLGCLAFCLLAMISALLGLGDDQDSRDK